MMDVYTALRVLELQPGCTHDDVKKAFHKLAHKYHPDKGGDGEYFKKVSAAYHDLKGQTLPSAQSSPPRYRVYEEGEVQDPPTTQGPREYRTYKPPAGSTPFGTTDENGSFTKADPFHEMREKYRRQWEDLRKQTDQEMERRAQAMRDMWQAQTASQAAMNEQREEAMKKYREMMRRMGIDI